MKRLLTLWPIDLGPDARRYIHVARCGDVTRPYHLRRLLPFVCGTNLFAWWTVWLLSWPLLAAAMFAWRIQHDSWQVAAASTALLCGLPGIVAFHKFIPVQVDLPATALSVAGVALIDLGDPFQVAAGVIVLCIAAAVKEQAPLWAALWLWSLWPLIALVVPVAVAFRHRPGVDHEDEFYQRIADHPVVTAFEHHWGRYRDAWLMVAPWGACLAALYEPDWHTLVVLAAAYAVLLVATDTVRLVQHAAAPVMAAAAASNIPVEWLLLAVVAHCFWWWKVERI